jgi:hypothetical protein
MSMVGSEWRNKTAYLLATRKKKERENGQVPAIPYEGIAQ